MYFRTIFYFPFPAYRLLGQLQLLSRDLGETLIIVECYYVSIYFCFILCFTSLGRIPLQRNTDHV